jgi:hypothetical protein
MFLAVSLDPAVHWLTARGLPRGLAVALILGVLLAILAAFLVSVIPHLVSQFTTLVHTLPSYLAKLADRSRRYQDLNARYHLSERLEGVVGQLPGRLASGALGHQPDPRRPDRAADRAGIHHLLPARPAPAAPWCGPPVHGGPAGAIRRDGRHHDRQGGHCGQPPSCSSWSCSPTSK